MKTTKQKKVIIYDNGGKTMDRYTVIIDKDAYGMNSAPLWPYGINQHVGEVGRNITLGKHLGKKVNINSLNPDVQKAIENRIQNS